MKNKEYQYTYIDPLKENFKKFSISKKEHNKIFKRFKLGIFQSAEYYYSEERQVFKIYKFANKFFVILNIIIFPFNLIFYGFANFKELLTAYKKMIFQKKYGSFSQQNVYSNHPEYQTLHSLLK